MCFGGAFFVFLFRGVHTLPQEIMAQPVEPMPVESVARPLLMTFSEEENELEFIEREKRWEKREQQARGYLTPPGTGMYSLPDSLDAFWFVLFSVSFEDEFFCILLVPLIFFVGLPYWEDDTVVMIQGG